MILEFLAIIFGVLFLAGRSLKREFDLLKQSQHVYNIYHSDDKDSEDKK